MPTVLAIRHGEVHNPTGVIYAGLGGFGLSDAGRTQAAKAAEKLAGMPVTAVYCSPLERAVETAEIVAGALGVGVTTDERLYEWRAWARWAGLTWAQLRTDAPDTWRAYREDPGSVTEGESLAQLGDRVLSWVGDAEAAHPGDGVVVGVSHLEPLRAAFLRFTGRPDSDLHAVQIGLGQLVRLKPDASLTL